MANRKSSLEDKDVGSWLLSEGLMDDDEYMESLEEQVYDKAGRIVMLEQQLDFFREASGKMFMIGLITGIFATAIALFALRGVM